MVVVVVVTLANIEMLPGVFAGEGGLCMWWLFRRVGDETALAALAACATLPWSKKHGGGEGRGGYCKNEKKQLVIIDFLFG